MLLNGYDIIGKAVTVDGKLVRAHIIELDAEAGWVKVELPPAIDIPEPTSTAQADGFTDLEEVEMRIKTLTGKVEIH